MDVLDKFLRKVSYKFPKGYPDPNDIQDMIMLEGMLKEIGIDLLLENQDLISLIKNNITGNLYLILENYLRVQVWVVPL